MNQSRRIILTGQFGRASGVKAVIDPGSKLCIGRTERADLQFGFDTSLSAVHCEASWDGETCRVRDLDSMSGTYVDGVKIEGEAVAPAGSWIKAGETVLSVYFEAHTPPRDLAPRDPEEIALADSARAALSQLTGRLYGIFDAARSPRILSLLNESVDECKSLYQGAKGDALADVAPYLVHFRNDSGLLGRLIDEGWGNAYGVFVESQGSFTAVRRHFRRFLIVEEAATGARMYFRFYDPRVLREFLPVATVRQRDELFDGLVAFLFEGEEGELVRVGHEAGLPSSEA